MLTKLLSVTLFALSLTTTTTVFAKGTEAIRSVEGITEYALDNGLQVLLFPDQSKDTITVNVTYQVGSKHENYGETGMAHLLEHLLFKGAKNHPDISKELTDRGAQANGTTYLERTNYYETFKASEENLKWALSMEADRMVNSFIAQEDLDSEMTVVRNEFERGENSPIRILIQRIYSTALDWHNYGNSTIGARTDIENVKIENLRAFYEKYYQPDNATLVVAGKFDTNKTLSLIRKTFGKIKKPRRTLPEFYTRDPEQDGERKIMLRRVGGEQAVAAAYRIPSGAHEDFAPLAILASILGDSPTGRLHKSLTEQHLATSTFAWPNQQKEPSLLLFNASVDVQTDLDATTNAMLKTLENIKDAPITEAEVTRAKRAALKDIELAFNNSQAISINLSEWIGIGDWRMLFIHRDRLEAVTLADVQRVAEHYLIPSNRTLGKFIPTDSPTRATIEPAPDIKDLVEGYKGREAVVAGEVFDATLENISQRQVLHEKDGIKISVVPIKTRGESVFIQMRMGIGDEESLENKGFVLSMMTSMLSRGTKNYTREALQDRLDELKAQGGFNSDEQNIYAEFETTRANLAKVISLIHEVLQTANFPTKEFDLLKAQQLSRLKANLTDPQALAFASVGKKLSTYPKEHIFGQHTIEESIAGVEAVTLKDVKAFYARHLGADSLSVGIAGDIDQESISKLILEKFAGWKAKVAPQRVVMTFQNADKVTDVINTPDKKNAVFIAAKNLPLNDQHEDAAALYVATRILGGGFINSRLASRIRQQDGLSYSIGAFFRAGSVDNNARWFAYAISAPENTEKVESAFREEMLRAINDGVTQEELDSAVSALLDAAKVRRSNNRVLAGILNGLLYDNSSFEKEIAMREKLRALSLKDVNEVMKKYLDPNTMTIVKAGDFEEKGE